MNQQELNIERQRRALEEEREHFGASKGSEYDVMHLNVGGERIDVLRMTLVSIEELMLASQFSGCWDDSLVKDRDGNFFIDQPMELFRPLVNLLRAKVYDVSSSLEPKAPPSLKAFKNDKDKLQDFLRMCDYLGVTHGVYPFAFEQLATSSKAEEGEKIPKDYFPCVDIVTWQSRTLFLKPSNHKARVKAFEVRISGTVTQLQVGWIKREATRSGTPPLLSQNKSAVSLDILHATYHVGSSNTTPVTSGTISVAKGMSIICTRYQYTFRINDDEPFHFPSSPVINWNSHSDRMVPAVSGIGSWQIMRLCIDP